MIFHLNLLALATTMATSMTWASPAGTVDLTHNSYIRGQPDSFSPLDASELSTLMEVITSSTATMLSSLGDDDDDDEDETTHACLARLAALERLASLGAVSQLVDLAFSLPPSSRSSLALLPACLMEETFDGLASLRTQVMTIAEGDVARRIEENEERRDAMNMSVRQSVKLGSSSSWLKFNSWGGSMFLKTNDQVPVHGVTLSGEFFALNSPLRCWSAKPEANAEANANALTCHDGVGEVAFASAAAARSAAGELLTTVQTKRFEESVGESNRRRATSPSSSEHVNEYTKGDKKVSERNTAIERASFEED